MRCNEFLRAYSDYRDGLIADAAAIRRVHEHLAACERCRRYDLSITWGVSTLRASYVDPDPESATRLHALAPPAAHTPPVPTHASVFATMLVVAAFGLIAWDALRDTTPVVEAAEPAAPVASTPELPAPPIVVANPGVPFVRFADYGPREAPPARSPDPTPLSSLTLYQGTSDR